MHDSAVRDFPLKQLRAMIINNVLLSYLWYDGPPQFPH